MAKNDDLDGMTIGGIFDMLAATGFRRKDIKGIEGSIVGAKVVWARKTKELTEYLTYTVSLK